MQVRWGVVGEEAKILDFANMVFSQAHRPHDFKKLLPKVYAKDDFAPLHAMAVEGEQILAMAALLPGELVMGKHTIRYGYVGTVSAHPYHCGQGLMKDVMRTLHRRAEEEDLDVLLLGGRRHRYHYFGYERMSGVVSMYFDRDCQKHALKDVDDDDLCLVPLAANDTEALEKCKSLHDSLMIHAERPLNCFFNTLSSWQAMPYLVKRCGKIAGYVVLQNELLTEWAFDDLSELLPALKAILHMQSHVTIEVAEADFAARRMLQNRCEHYHIHDGMMMRVLNWERLLHASVGALTNEMTNSPATTSLRIGAETQIHIDWNKRAVTAQSVSDDAEIIFPDTQSAVNTLFSPLYMKTGMKDLPLQYLPLPLYLLKADQF